MRLILKYVKGNPKTGTWTYRREVPEKLRDIIGKREIKKKLGNSRKEALRKYEPFNKGIEKVIDAAREYLAKQQLFEDDLANASPRQTFEIARAKMISLGLDPSEDGLDPESDEAIHRDTIVEAIGAKYPEDSETGHPIGVKPKLNHFI